MPPLPLMRRAGSLRWIVALRQLKCLSLSLERQAAVWPGDGLVRALQTPASGFAMGAGAFPAHS